MRNIVKQLTKIEGVRTGVIVPGVALKKGEGVFLDNLTLEEVERRLGAPVHAAYSAEELRELLQAWR